MWISGVYKKLFPIILCVLKEEEKHDKYQGMETKRNWKIGTKLGNVI
jgi:hypothetical protein